MREYITERALVKAAERTAEMYGLKCPERETIWKMYYSSGKYPQPVITFCDRGMMWVDKYYVAYQIDDGDVHYTYLTRTHIAEECASYSRASKERGVKVSLSRDILKCFREVKRIMSENDMYYWISENILEENAD